MFVQKKSCHFVGSICVLVCQHPESLPIRARIMVNLLIFDGRFLNDDAQADIGSGWESPGTAALWGRKPAGTGRLGSGVS
jgi:hypothetical protein